MIIRRAEISKFCESTDFAWNGLRQFQNVHFTAKRISEYHNIDEKNSNVIKQSQQVRFCLQQAEEYFAAAKTVSLATKPLLLYYGVMSLALAEILVKQDGESSLDKARDQHAHHGLSLVSERDPSKQNALEDSAKALRAAPMTKAEGVRFGTFELWHKGSRETPMVGKWDETFSNGVNQNGWRLMALGSDTRPQQIPERGITLLECFQHTPQMKQLLAQNSITDKLVRASLFESVINQTGHSRSFVAHPANEENIELIKELFFFHPSIIEDLDIIEHKNSFLIRSNHKYEHPVYPTSLPFGFQMESKEVWLSCDQKFLNEFGIIYYALYILGNYARYYPDRWMVDVEKSSSLSLAVRLFLQIAERRAPILSLSEMNQTWYVVES